MNRKEKKELLIEDLINKMFEIAGHKVTFDDIKDRKDDWFTQWTMTEQQNEEWYDWGVEQIRKRFRYSKKFSQKEMGMINLMWGLKLEDFIAK